MEKLITVVGTFVMAIVFSLLVAVIVGLLLAWPIMLLWNWLVPESFGGPVLNFWQMFGLVILLRLLIPVSAANSKS